MRDLTIYRKAIALMRLLTAITAVGCALSFLVVPFIFQVKTDKAENAMKRYVKLSDEISNPRFVSLGIDEKPYTITAKAAYTRGENNISLINPLGTLQEKDAPAYATAQQGFYDRKTQILKLDHNVRFWKKGNYEILAPQAFVAIREGKISGQSGVKGKGPWGTWSAKAFDFQESKDVKKLVLRNQCRLEISASS